ncbi:MAG: NAD(P)H-binding protein [Candidatus Phaeomarinobacter sp.]
MTSQPRLLVIGATGGIGSEVAKAARAAGWAVRAMHRHPRKAARSMADLDVEWVKGDAMRARDVARAARKCDVIFHGANPPGYKKWKQLAIPMLRNTIAAAEAVDARIAFPGNVYVYGDDAFPVLGEDAPQHPPTEKGNIRTEMEYMLRRTPQPALIVRAGDFFGPNAPGSWVGGGMIKPGKPVSSITYPGDPKTLHAFAYLPDLAETFIRLLSKPAISAADFEIFHFEGLTTGGDTVVSFPDALRQAAGVPEAPIKRLPWAAVGALGLFNETYRELVNMRYLWDTAHRLDNAKLVAAIGDEPHTPLEEALRMTLAGHGCLAMSAQKKTGHAAAAA